MKKIIFIWVMASMSILSSLNAGKDKDLWNAAKAGDIKKVDTALKKNLFGFGGADINFVHKGMTPLMIACAQGHPDVVKDLIERKAAVLLPKDSRGYTALIYAIGSGKADIVEKVINAAILEANKISPEALNFINARYGGLTPLEHAEENAEKVTDKKKYKDVIRKLKAAGAIEGKEVEEKSN